jgi:hypothetical protein
LCPLWPIIRGIGGKVNLQSLKDWSPAPDVRPFMQYPENKRTECRPEPLLHCGLLCFNRANVTLFSSALPSATIPTYQRL